MDIKQYEFLYENIIDKTQEDASAAFNTAVEKCDKNGDTLFIAEGIYEIGSDVVIPEYIDLVFEEDAMISVKDGASFTFNGKTVTANGQIFKSGKGVFGFSNVSYLRPEWFGAKPDGRTDSTEAFRAACRLGENVFLSEGKYCISGNITLFEDKGSINVTGAGMGKTVIEAENGISLFDHHKDENKKAPYAIHIHDLSMTEIGGKRTSVAVDYNGGSDCNVENCSFEGFKVGVYTSDSGWIHVFDCEFENNFKACEIGPHSMFLYFKFCHSYRDGYFLFCEVPPSGGYSNGIDVNGCLIEQSEECGIYTTENQAVFIDDCAVFDFKGNCGIYCYKDFDTEISNCQVKGEGDADTAGIKLVCSHSQYIFNNHISEVGTGVHMEGPYDWRCMSAIDRNAFEKCRKNYISVDRTNDFRVINNIYDGRLEAEDEILLSNATVNGDGLDNGIGDTDGYMLETSLYPHLVAKETDAFAVTRLHREEMGKLGGNMLYNREAEETDAVITASADDFEILLKASPRRENIYCLKKGIYNVNENAETDENVSFRFERGAVIKVADGKTLKINGRIFAGSYKIFDGTVICRNSDFAFAEWFGEVENENADFAPNIQKAVNANGKVLLPKTKFKMASTVVLPDNRDVVISGFAIKQTVIDPSAKGLLFTHNGGLTVFENIHILGKEACKGADFAKINGGSVVTFNVIWQGMNKVFDCKNVDGFYSYLSRNIAIEHFFDFENSKNMVLDSLLDPPGCGYFLRGNNCENFIFYNIASVSGHSIDITMKNSKNIKIKQGGLDASGYRNEEEYKTSYCAAEFINCDDILFEGHWVATAINPPGYERKEDAVKRDNLHFDGCRNVKVIGNSLVNSRKSFVMRNCKDVLIVGNKGEASLQGDFDIKDCENVTLAHNFCMSYAWRKTEREIELADLKNSFVGYNSLGYHEYPIYSGDSSARIEGNRFDVVAGDPAVIAEAMPKL